MADHRAKKDAIEVTSQPLADELAAIKDRLSAIETIQSISNAKVVSEYVEQALLTDRAREVLRACQQPQTKSQLVAALKFNSPQALDHHLKPLRDADLLRQNVDEGGSITIEWSNLLRRLPRKSLDAILSPRSGAKK